MTAGGGRDVALVNLDGGTNRKPNRELLNRFFQYACAGGRDVALGVRTNRELSRVAKAAVGDMLVSEDVRPARPPGGRGERRGASGEGRGEGPCRGAAP